MLDTLHIENVALADDVTIRFDKGLNVISGETGAGKSILLDSLSFVFGGRADRSLIRVGESRMRVEAIFTKLDEDFVEFIRDELNISCEEELFLSRELDKNGRNICKINGELTPVAVVKKLCLKLVDIHGQSEHLAILDNAYQLHIVDLYSKRAEDVLNQLNLKIDDLQTIEREIAGLGGSETEKRNLIDLYSYQIDEIEKANIQENELETLIIEKKEMQHFEKINESLRSFLASSVKNPFSESALERLTEAKKSLNALSDINEHYRELTDRMSSLIIELNDINDTVTTDIDNNVFDQERFDFIDIY